MVDDNRKLASRIDGSIQSANKEMFMLRQELDDTNRRLLMIRETNFINGRVKRSPTSPPHDSKCLLYFETIYF